MHPKFAVVGHPNKGKSTIVANLAMDDSIAISPLPGTTIKAASYPLKIDGKIIYELIDTPGFQRPRAIYAWLSQKDVPIHLRFERLKEFIETFKDDERFREDIEILRPIVQGAGIIYVVDASKPYSLEFELDMKILSYAGAPSMAILNFIEQEDYSNEWKSVLTHYFKIIKRFNPMKSSLKEYKTLLEALSHLNDEWFTPMQEAKKAIDMLYKQKIAQSALFIAQFLKECATFSIKSTNKTKEQLLEEFKRKITAKEKKLFENIIKIWEHHNILIDLKEIDFSFDIFSQESKEIFGLSQKEALIIGAGVGATIGGGIDLAFLGHTLLAGAGIGAVLGGIGAYLGFEKALEVKVLGVELGKEILQIGPIKEKNFLFILLNRVLFFTKTVATLSFAKRETIILQEAKELLKQKEKKEFFALLGNLDKNYDKLIKAIDAILTRVIKDEA